MKVYMDTAHHFVSIHIYSTSPKRYTTAKCEHHEHHQLIEACSECHQRFCIRCDSKSGCAKVAGDIQLHYLLFIYSINSKLLKLFMKYRKATGKQARKRILTT